MTEYLAFDDLSLLNSDAFVMSHVEHADLNEQDVLPSSSCFLLPARPVGHYGSSCLLGGLCSALLTTQSYCQLQPT